MKNLVLLDLRILLGADIPWAHVRKQPDAPSDLATAALLQAGGGDDDSVSSKDDAEVPEAAAPQAAAPEAAAPEAAAPAPDPNNFLTWTHQNWDKVPFDLISFPSGQTPLKTRTYCHFSEHSVIARTAFNRLERADRSVGGYIRRGPQQRKSGESPIHRAKCVF